MHDDEQKRGDEAAFRTNWVSTVGESINAVEKAVADYIEIYHAMASNYGIAAQHLTITLTGEKLYGAPRAGHGTLEDRKVLDRSV